MTELGVIRKQEWPRYYTSNGNEYRDPDKCVEAERVLIMQALVIELRMAEQGSSSLAFKIVSNASAIMEVLQRTITIKVADTTA